MSRYRVVVAPRARTQLKSLDAWWRDSPPDAPDLVASEFWAAVAQLLEYGSVGSRSTTE